MTAGHAGTNRPERVTQLFRSDILGLRGVAVLALVLFHFGFPVSGGFAAYDILFVLTGFTIGGSLWREYETTGEVWLPDFLSRRARRLLRALLIVLAATAALGWSLLLPNDFAALGLATTAAVLQVPNLLVWLQGDYFSALSGTQPLLHLWAIGAGVQAILLLALAFRVMGRNTRGLLWLLGGLCLGSLVGCIAITPVAPGAAFFLPPFRLWEVLAGALLAIWGQCNGRVGPGPAALSWLGAVLVAAALLLTPAGNLYPGTIALVPVIGTLALLTSGTCRNLVNRGLAGAATQMLGQIAFPLFLWHWPVLVLGSALREGEDVWPTRLSLLAVSLALSWLTTDLLRRVVSGGARRRALVGAAIGLGLAVAALSGLWVHLRAGLPQRFGPEVMAHLAAVPRDGRPEHCGTATHGPLMGLETCRIGPEGAPRLLVWGDDTLRPLVEGVHTAAERQQLPGLLVMRDGCPPLFALRKTDSAGSPTADIACHQANTQIKQALGHLDTVEQVLLVARWTLYATGRGVGLDAARTVTLRAEDLAQGSTSQPRLLVRAAQDTTAVLRSRLGIVQVLRQPPEIPGYDAGRAARAAARAGLPFAAPPDTTTSVSRDSLAVRVALADAPWQLLAETGAVTMIDPWPLICDDLLCSAIRDGVGLYSDNARLSGSAGHLLSPLMARAFARPAPPRALSSASLP